MAEVFDLYVYDNRTIKYNILEPIMQEDNGVAVWRFRIPKVLNNIDMSGWAWWFVYVNAAKEKYSEPLTLVADTDDPDNFNTAEYTIDYGISLTPGGFTFALEAINANGSGDIVGEWHTRIYNQSVTSTLQGNQAEYAETESDIISALIVQIQEKYNALVGGATPLVVSSVSAMTDTTKIYVLSTDGDWYYYNGTAWVSGGQYASGIVIDPTLTQSGQAADAKVVGDRIDACTKVENVIIIHDNLRKNSFNPTAGTTANNTKRLTYLGGFALRGAKAVDIKISNGYKWNIYFANTLGSYALIEQYSSAWIDVSKNFIVVPDEANRLYIACVKADNTDFTDEEIASVFSIKLRGAEEPEIYTYDFNTDFKTNYYGTYQYVNGSTQPNQFARLTQDRFYEIGTLKTIRFKPHTGYKAAVNFFDANFVCLGNTGSWITGHTLIIIPNLYATAKYFKITIVRTDNAIMSATDFNQFDILYYYVNSVAPVFGSVKLSYVNAWNFTSGDVAIYDGNILVGNTNKLTINGVDVNAEIGHGNNIMFGKTLYNNFPKLYAGGFYNWNKCVFVNAITQNSATLLETIVYNALPTGYTNICVDEQNQKVYIFEETGEDTYQGRILFAVGDFDGNIITSKMLPVSIPIIQGMDFADGFCYVTSGDGTPTYPNYLMVFDVDGNLLSKSKIDLGEEIEGISITENDIYIKGLKTLFKVV